MVESFQDPWKDLCQADRSYGLDISPLLHEGSQVNGPKFSYQTQGTDKKLLPT